jgi:hypothetical protein
VPASCEVEFAKTFGAAIKRLVVEVLAAAFVNPNSEITKVESRVNFGELAECRA